MAMFDPNLGAPTMPTAPQANTSTSSPATTALAGLSALVEDAASGISGYEKAKVKADAAQQKLNAGSAINDYQSNLIDLENKYLGSNKQKADLISRAASLEQQKISGNLDPQGAAQLSQLQSKINKLQSAQSLGMSDTTFQIKANLLKKQALNDPRLAGFGKEINTMFGHEIPSSGEPNAVDKLLTPEDKQRLGANPSPEAISALLAEKQFKANYQFQAFVGKADYQKLSTLVAPHTHLETSKVMDAMQTRYDKQGALTPQDQDEFNLQLDNIKQSQYDAVSKAIQHSQSEGHIITPKQQQALYQEVDNSINSARDWVKNKDLHSRLAKYNDLRKQLMLANLPAGVVTASQIGVGGTGGDLTSAMQILNMNDTQLKALGGDHADLIAKNAELRLKTMEATINGVHVPGMERLQTFIGATMLKNGTTDAAHKQTLKTLGDATSQPDMQDSLKFLNRPDVVSKVKQKKDVSKPELDRLASNYVLNLKGRDIGGAQVVAQDGKLVLKPTEYTGGNPKPPSADARFLVQEFNNFLHTYSDVINKNKYLKPFEEQQNNSSGQQQQKDTSSTQRAPMYQAGGSMVPGQISKGNIDIANRPIVHNKDGSISTVRSVSFSNDKGQEVLVPTVSPDGKNWTPDEAWQHYLKTGQNLGVFKDVKAANAYAEKLHEQQAKMYVN